MVINLVSGFLIGIAVWFLGKRIIAWRWPYQAIIAEKRGSAIRWVFDRAARFKSKKDPEVQKFKLKKSKDGFSPPTYEHIHIDKKGKNVLPLFNPEQGQYFPMEISNPLGGLRVQDKDIAFYGSLERERIKRKYATEDWLQKYGALVGIMMVVGILAFIVIWLGGVFQQVGSQTIQAMQIAADTASKLAQASPPIPTPTPPLGG